MVVVTLRYQRMIPSEALQILLQRLVLLKSLMSRSVTCFLTPKNNKLDKTVVLLNHVDFTNVIML